MPTKYLFNKYNSSEGKVELRQLEVSIRFLKYNIKLKNFRFASTKSTEENFSCNAQLAKANTIVIMILINLNRGKLAVHIN